MEAMDVVNSLVNFQLNGLKVVGIGAAMFAYAAIQNALLIAGRRIGKKEG